MATKLVFAFDADDTAFQKKLDALVAKSDKAGKEVEKKIFGFSHPGTFLRNFGLSENGAAAFGRCPASLRASSPARAFHADRQVPLVRASRPQPQPGAGDGDLEARTGPHAPRHRHVGPLDGADQRQQRRVHAIGQRRQHVARRCPRR